jgi:hypothetical protein
VPKATEIHIMELNISVSYCNFIFAVEFGPGTTYRYAHSKYVLCISEHIVLLLGVQEIIVFGHLQYT